MVLDIVYHFSQKANTLQSQLMHEFLLKRFTHAFTENGVQRDYEMSSDILLHHLFELIHCLAY